MATFYQMQRYDARTNIAEFSAQSARVSPQDSAGLLGLDVRFQWIDGKKIGAVVATDFDSRNGRAVITAQITDQDTRHMLAEGALTGIALLDDNSIVVRDVPVDKAATFEYITHPAERLQKALIPNRAAPRDLARFGNASKSFPNFWARPHISPEVRKRAATPTMHPTPFPETTGFSSGEHRDLTDDYALAKTGRTLCHALRRVASTSNLPGCSPADVTAAASLSKSSIVTRPVNPDRNRLAYRNANQRLIERKAELSYIAADAVGRGVARKLSKTWTDEARQAAAAARKHGWQTKHEGTNHIELQHPELSSHKIIYNSNSTWQHTTPASNDLFGRVRASGQGTASLAQHLREYHEVVKPSERSGAGGASGPVNPYHRAKE